MNVCQREDQTRELLLREAIQQVRLVFVLVERHAELVVEQPDAKLFIRGDACIVASRHLVATVFARALEQHGNFQARRANRAREREAPRLDAGNCLRLDLGCETLRQIDDVMLDAERLGHFFGMFDFLLD